MNVNIYVSKLKMISKFWEYLQYYIILLYIIIRIRYIKLRRKFTHSKSKKRLN